MAVTAKPFPNQQSCLCEGRSTKPSYMKAVLRNLHIFSLVHCPAWQPVPLRGGVFASPKLPLFSASGRCQRANERYWPPHIVAVEIRRSEAQAEAFASSEAVVDPELNRGDGLLDVNAWYHFRDASNRPGERQIARVEVVVIILNFCRPVVPKRPLQTAANCPAWSRNAGFDVFVKGR